MGHVRKKGIFTAVLVGTVEGERSRLIKSWIMIDSSNKGCYKKSKEVSRDKNKERICNLYSISYVGIKQKALKQSV